MNNQKIAWMAGCNADTLPMSAQAECLLLDLAELKQQVESILRIIGMSPDDPSGGKQRRSDELPTFSERNNHRYDIPSPSA